ncbi:ABC transporter ATP-binding protein [Rubrobacter calidifluminis]|uniref:ABC transporter ATP-binding protein n=1 Tax=Rubrobacter calidifluminis TaxID=1392640 RepID=UPI002360D19C|nr:ATP-binding cassette domain-containing protein [Rubrobacter calidifluminis]
MASSIVVEDLVRKYGAFAAVDGISFRVEEGEIFGFLGPNGAGKSTTIKILTTLLLPTSGKVEVAGHDVVKEPGAVRMEVGVALQEIGVDPLLTGRELLEVQARLFGMPKRRARQRADELLSLVGLEEAAGRRTGSYSGGMRRKLDLALALVHGPGILVLDEPPPASTR